MGDRLIRWLACAAALAALSLAASPSQAAPSPHTERASHGSDHAGSIAGQHHHELAHDRYLERRRALRNRRWARHWRLSHHHLVFVRPGHARPRPAPRPDPDDRLTPRPEAFLHSDRRSLLILAATAPTPAAPAATPAQAAAAPAVDLATQLGQLNVAVAEVMKGARLDVPAALATGGEGKVVLTLPAELSGTLQAKSGQVGLGGAARKTFLTAKLAGQGYAIVPNQEQTARLQPGEPTVFSWDVKSSPTPGGVLTADMTGSLQGDGDDKTFALGAVTAQIPVGGQAAPAPAPIEAPAAQPLQVKLPDLSHIRLGAIRPPDLSRLQLRGLSIPGHPTVAVPGLGQVPSYKVVAAGIVALVLLLLIAVLRSASARRERAERRRRFHSFEASHLGDEHP